MMRILISLLFVSCTVNSFTKICLPRHEQLIASSSSHISIDTRPRSVVAPSLSGTQLQKCVPSTTKKITPFRAPTSLSLMADQIGNLIDQSMKQRFFVIIAFSSLVGYHINLFVKEKNGGKTWRTSQADTREQWSQFVRKTEGWLYAVQTLRNAITANTFLATTVLSLLTLIAGRIWDIVRTSARGSSGREQLMAQFVAITICMLSSAYGFLQSARLMTHAGFMFPVNTGTKVDSLIRRSQNTQWIGLRWLYVSLNMFVWTIGGDTAFMVSALAFTQYFRKIDSAPKDIVA